LRRGKSIYSIIYVIVVSPPSPESKRKSSLERNPSGISSRQIVVDHLMMENFLGTDYTIDEIK
jgi:hypothetical protein